MSVPVRPPLRSAAVELTGGARRSYLNLPRSQDALAVGTTYPFQDHQLIPELRPDTLYSWAHRSEWLAPYFRDPTFQRPFDRASCMWRTPIGSSNYGRYSVRAKLRDGVEFREVPPWWSRIDVHKYPEELGAEHTGDNSVFVRPLPELGFHEYIVINPNVFHSVSVRTPEHLRELRSELGVIEHAPTQEAFDLVFHKDARGFAIGPAEAALGAHIDGTISTANMRTKLKGVEAWAAAEPEQLMFHPSADPDRADHFASRAMPYWDLEASGAVATGRSVLEVLRETPVREVAPLESLPLIPQEGSFSDVVDWFQSSEASALPIVGANNEVVGLISRALVDHLVAEGKPRPPTDMVTIAVIDPGESLEAAVGRMISSSTTGAAFVDASQETPRVGVVTRDVVSAHIRAALREAQL